MDFSELHSQRCNRTRERTSLCAASGCRGRTAGEGRHQQAAYDGDILDEIDYLAFMLRTRQTPEFMENEGNRNQERCHDKSGVANVKAGYQQQSASQLNLDGEHQSHLGK